jgi:hypothetical protein
MIMTVFMRNFVRLFQAGKTFSNKQFGKRFKISKYNGVRVVNFALTTDKIDDVKNSFS